MTFCLDFFLLSMDCDIPPLSVCFVDSCLSFFLWPLCCLFFSCGHCVVCSSIYGFWLPLWYLQTLLSYVEWRISSLVKDYDPLLLFALVRGSCNFHALPSLIPYNDIILSQSRWTGGGCIVTLGRWKWVEKNRNPLVLKGKSIFKSSVIEIRFSSCRLIVV